MRFATNQGLILAINAYLRDAFDVLYAEGETAPKMMSVAATFALAGGFSGAILDYAET